MTAKEKIKVETFQYMYSNAEIVEILLKKEGIHEGHWSFSVEFTLGATVAGPTVENLTPTAMAGVQRIGLRLMEKPTPFSFDASIVNPKAADKNSEKSKPTKKSSSKKKSD